MLSIFYSVNKEYYKIELDDTYFESQQFVNRYMYALKYEIRSLIHNAGDANVVTKEGTRVFYRPTLMTGFSNLKDFQFFIIHYPSNKVYTNAEFAFDIPNLEEIQNQIEESNGK